MAIFAVSHVGLATLLVPGLAILWSVKLSYGRVGASRRDPMRLGMLTTGWLFTLIGFLALVVGFPNPLTVVLGLVALSVVLSAARHYRRLVMDSFAWSLAIATERGVPLDEAAEAFARDRVDGIGSRALRLADQLKKGAPLPLALFRSRLVCRPEVLLAARFGWETGLLGPSLHLASRVDIDRDRDFRLIAARCYYLVLVSIGSVAIFSTTLFLLVPDLAGLHEEFEIEMSWSTRLIVDLSTWLTEVGWPVAALVVLGLLGVVILGALGLLGPLSRKLPAASRLWHRHDGALLLKYLGLGIRHGQSLPRMFEVFARTFPSNRLRTQLIGVNASVERGTSWLEALARSRVIGAAEVAVLRAAEQADNLAWALTEVSDSMLRRIGYRLALMANILLPFALGVVGLIVLVQGMLILGPLTDMLEKMS